MDRALTKIEQSKSYKGTIKWFVIAGALIFLSILVLRKYISPSIAKDKIVTARTEIGDIQNTLTASGTVQPSFETTINSPISTEIEAVILRPGKEVKKGDHILSLNQEFIRLQVESLKDELQLKKNGVKKSSIVHQKSTKDLEYQNGILALRIQSLKAGLNDYKRLMEIGGSTEEIVEKAALDLQVQELEKKKLENNLFYSEAIFESDQENLNLEVNIKENDLKKLIRQMGQAKVQANTKGIITWINSNIGQKVAEGSPLVRIADLTTFQVEGKISDRYGSTLNVGQEIEFRIGNGRHKGFISSILPEITNNTMSFIADFSEETPLNLRPNMTVDIFIITARKNNVLLLKNGPGYDGSKRFDVYVVRDGYGFRETIDVGLVNTDFIEVLSDEIKSGDEIIISDIEEFDHLDKIEIK